MGLGVDIFPQISSNGNSGAFFVCLNFLVAGKLDLVSSERWLPLFVDMSSAWIEVR